MQTWYFNSFQNGPKDKSKRLRPHPITSDPRLLCVAAATAAAATFILIASWTSYDPNFFCSLATGQTFLETDAEIASEFESAPLPLVAILHYATSSETSQQTPAEIRDPFEILQYLAPCNFLVFGIGHDSLMWDSLNPRGTTVFLEEDTKWTRAALHRFPVLRAYNVRYPTRLSDAPVLLSSYKKDCWPTAKGANVQLKGNKRCKLALPELPEEVYDSDWDIIMIDGPRGYFAAAPGRMGVIYSAAVMARARKRQGVTHVFLHDADRKVERRYAAEFLCMKYKVGGVGRLWHFVIPPAVNLTHPSGGFCN